MKSKYSYIGIVFVILLFGIYVVRNYKHHIEPRDRVTQQQKEEEVNPSGLMYFEVNNVTRKMPDFVFTDQNNQTISNADYAGKVYVAEFFFTSCPSICPIMNQNMLKIEKVFGDRTDFGIASFTIDPTTDTPIKLKEYAERYGVTSLNWHFLTGDQDQLFEMANKGLNIFAGINPDVAGGFEHQGFFALVDKNGFLRSRKDTHGNPKIFYQGTEEAEVQMLIEDIQLLLEKE
ncbi:SCO family protein [Ochrovirga pacifica]|uniref:SCO family protein n=1 Tax=Ochrovirga pacifica TaxID=1042376 RepID=UPI0002558014|nr:SCO family protein [Ochrovirga pacifica]